MKTNWQTIVSWIWIHRKWLDHLGIIRKQVIQQWTSSFRFARSKGLWESIYGRLNWKSFTTMHAFGKNSRSTFNHWSYTKPKKSYPQLHQKMCQTSNERRWLASTINICWSVSISSQVVFKKLKGRGPTRRNCVLGPLRAFPRKDCRDGLF